MLIAGDRSQQNHHPISTVYSILNRLRMEMNNFLEPRTLPSGKLSDNYGQSQFSMGKSTISMVIFNSYVWHNQRVLVWIPSLRKKWPSNSVEFSARRFHPPWWLDPLLALGPCTWLGPRLTTKISQNPFKTSFPSRSWRFMTIKYMFFFPKSSGQQIYQSHQVPDFHIQRTRKTQPLQSQRARHIGTSGVCHGWLGLHSDAIFKIQTRWTWLWKRLFLRLFLIEKQYFPGGSRVRVTQFSLFDLSRARAAFAVPLQWQTPSAQEDWCGKPNATNHPLNHHKWVL